MKRAPRASSVSRAQSPALLAVLVLLGCARDAAAQPRPAETDAEVTARLAYIERALAHQQPRIRLWRDIATVAFAGLALGQLGLGLSVEDPQFRVTAFVGAAKTTLGLTAVLVAPFTAYDASTKLRAVAAGTPAERREKLRLAESLLRQAAKEETFRRSWLPQVGAAAVNLAGSIFVWARYRYTVPGWTSLGAGLAVGQLQYHTQPLGMVDAWNAYVHGRAAPPPARTSLWVMPVGTSLVLGGSF